MPDGRKIEKSATISQRSGNGNNSNNVGNRSGNKAYEYHRSKVREATSKIDVDPPKRRPHVTLNAKRLQLERERQARIARDNFILVKKLCGIMQRKKAKEESHRLVWQCGTCLKTR